MARRRLTFEARAQAAAAFDETAPQTPLHKGNNPYRLDLIFQALSDRHRRLMVSTLSRGASPTSELVGLAASTWSTGRKHLQVLELSGLVHTEKIGRERICSLDADMLKTAEAWLAKRSRQ